VSDCCKSMLYCLRSSLLLLLFFFLSFFFLIYESIAFSRISKSQSQSTPQVAIKLRAHGSNRSFALDTGEHSRVRRRSQQRNSNGSRHRSRVCRFLDGVVCSSRRWVYGKLLRFQISSNGFVRAFDSVSADRCDE